MPDEVGEPLETAMAERFRALIEKIERTPLCSVRPAEAKSQTISSIAAGLAHLRQTEEQVLAESDSRRRYNQIREANPWTALVSAEEWQLAEKERQRRRSWEEEMTVAWGRHVLACAILDTTIRPKSELMAELAMKTRFGLSG